MAGEIGSLSTSRWEVHLDSEPLMLPATRGLRHEGTSQLDPGARRQLG
jgi:hypothetical protein